MHRRRLKPLPDFYLSLTETGDQFLGWLTRRHPKRRQPWKVLKRWEKEVWGRELPPVYHGLLAFEVRKRFRAANEARKTA